jgi:hypothetical protein
LKLLALQAAIKCLVRVSEGVNYDYDHIADNIYYTRDILPLKIDYKPPIEFYWTLETRNG